MIVDRRGRNQFLNTRWFSRTSLEDESAAQSAEFWLRRFYSHFFRENMRKTETKVLKKMLPMESEGVWGTGARTVN